VAADESIATMSKRLTAVGVVPTPEARRDYREILLCTPALSEWVSGMILCDETLHQKLRNGVPVPQAAGTVGIEAGIKVDVGVSPLAFSEGETVTEGLDGLRRRLAGYRAMGATFAKWRAVLVPGSSTDRGIAANAHALARYAALCQEADVVPIVEPEVLMDGDHGLEECAGVTSRVLAAVFDDLAAAGVSPSAMVLKPNMVISGGDRTGRDAPEVVARWTLELLRARVPEAIPGIAFLSGGQTNEQACANLAAINREAAVTGGVPWRLTFSFGRALVSDALHTWAGDPAKERAAQSILAANCERASRASLGLDTEPVAHG
jgi:fructose-bisphosphate aldolase class I